eukprot:COSAG01_NODE_258_length_20077_cov_124.162429_6_plen_119_part_00
MSHLFLSRNIEDGNARSASEKHERNLGRMPSTDGGLEMYDVGDGMRTWRLHASRAALRASPLLQEAREWLVARQRCGAGGVDGGSQMFGNVGGCQSTFSVVCNPMIRGYRCIMLPTTA